VKQEVIFFPAIFFLNDVTIWDNVDRKCDVFPVTSWKCDVFPVTSYPVMSLRTYVRTYFEGIKEMI
jgi:hypothetical protein